MATAKTAKSLAPMTVLVHCTNSFMVSGDHRCRRSAAAEAKTQSSASYDRARPCWHLKMIMASLNSVRCRIGSQWRSHNTGVMWSDFLVPVTTCDRHQVSITIGPTSRKNLLTFGGDPVWDTDSGSLFHFPHQHAE